MEKQARKEFFKAVGKYLQAKRETAGLTQFEVAKLSGYKPQFISNIERGGAFPPTPLLSKMIQAYHIGQEEFLVMLMNMQMDFYKKVYFPALNKKKS